MRTRRPPTGPTLSLLARPVASSLVLVRISVGPSARQSVCLFVCLSVRLSIRWSVVRCSFLLFEVCAACLHVAHQASRQAPKRAPFYYKSSARPGVHPRIVRRSVLLTGWLTGGRSVGRSAASFGRPVSQRTAKSSDKSPPRKLVPRSVAWTSERANERSG